MIEDTTLEKIGAGFRAVLNSYAKDLGAPDNFLYGLLEEHALTGNDWSLVVKLHAFLESSCIDALVRDLGPVSDKFVFAQNMGGDAGRIALMLARGLLTAEQAEFCAAFGALRNRLVHTVRNTSVVLTTSFKDSRFAPIEARLRRLVLPGLPATTWDGKRRMTAQDVWEETPGLALHWTVAHTLRKFAHDWIRDI